MSGDEEVLVCGVTGFIGSAVAGRLMQSGYRVSGLVRTDSGTCDHCRVPVGTERLEFDSRDGSALRATLHNRRFRAVFNFAAYGVVGSQRDSRLMHAANVEFAPKIIEVLGSCGLYVHVGSGFEFGHGHAGQRIDETATPAPFSEYGRTKLAGALAARDSADCRNMPFVLLRLFHTYGPGEPESRLTQYLIRQLQHDEPADLSPGTQVRDFLHVEDVAAACIRLLQIPVADLAGETFHLCSGEPVTIRDVGGLIARQMGKPESLLRWGAIPARSEEPHWLVGSPGKFRAVTGWEPRFRLPDGIRTLIPSLLPAPLRIAS